MGTPKLNYRCGAAGAILCLAVALLQTARAQHDEPAASAVDASAKPATMIVAGGCFWCVETDFEKAPGVIDVVSGYSGGRSKNPTYKTYSTGGHREVVLVTYDPERVTYAGLVEWLIKHIDPTNAAGQFNDKGLQYSPAVYYADEDEKAAAERVIADIEKMKIYGKAKINVDVEPRSDFWLAEEFHQNYHAKNPLKYSFFRAGSGRDAFVIKHWGRRAGVLELPGSLPAGNSQSEPFVLKSDSAKDKPWMSFRKPSPLELRQKLSPIQYKVTQQDGTEPAFRNEYWDSKKAGIYVDIVSGAPLFSSSAKYDSRTGWPSFVEPISREAVVFKLDRNLFSVRTEVRSRFGDSHLGHVFDDGPPDRGGKRYCMNSAALRFIPKEEMEAEGYAEYLPLVE